MIQVDRNTIIQLFGSLMQNPRLLDDTDRYKIEVGEFQKTLDKYIFSAIYNLYSNGAEKIRTVDVDNYLRTNDAAKSLMELENGVEFLQDCEAYAEKENFPYYYSRFKKLNLLREMQKDGADVSSIFCEDPLNEKYDEINTAFEQTTAEEIIKKLQAKIDIYENKYVFNSVVEESTPNKGIRALLESLKTAPECGVHLQGEIFNTVVRGGRRGTLYVRSGSTGLGKAIPDTTMIPTPSGWKKANEIQVGDYIFDRTGKPTRVLGVYPQSEKKRVYRVHFKSGRVAECCNEHLWSYYSNKNDKYPNKLITTTLSELMKNPLGLRAANGGYRWSVPICEPVNYPKKSYSIDPYVMGLILGDGSFRYTENQKDFCFSSNDEFLVQEITTRMGYKCYKKNSQFNYNWSFKLQKGTHKNVWVEDILASYPSLWKTKSETKFIPSDYLLGSVEQRYDLLAGLLDTDGAIDQKGRTSFTTVSPLIRDGIIELCESLGMTCSWHTDKRPEKYTTGECYSVHITCSKEAKLKMFKLPRKKERALAYFNNNKRQERKDRDAIIDIEETNEFVSMRCFWVDNEEHLFLMNNFITTHNTRGMVGDACEIAYPLRYEPEFGRWVSTGPCQKVLYVMTEQNPDEIQTMILSYLTGFNEETFLYGRFTPEHEKIIEKALQIMEDYKDNFLQARVPEPTSAIVKNLFRRYNTQYGVDIFFFDYIFLTQAMVDEYKKQKLADHVCLRMFTTTLKNLAIELQAFVMTSTQVSEQDNDKKNSWKDYHNIAGARAIAHLVDVGCIMSRPTQEELQQLEPLRQKFGILPNVVCDIYKNRRGRWTMVRIWSYHNLGTCRKYDLFITDTQLHPIEEFQIVDFTCEKTPEEEAIEAKYNDDNPTIIDDPTTMFTPQVVESITYNINTAFGTEQEQRQQVHNLKFEDLI